MYVQSKDKDIGVLNVEDLSAEGWGTKRFVLIIDYKSYEKVMGTDLWPQKIYFKQWYPRRPNDA